jgi:glyoxylase-like metal-dependent hydrolase (beta-lactamase superfamily II)
MPCQPAPTCSIQVGDIRVSYLPDGDGRTSATLTFPSSNEALWAAHPEYLDENRKWVASIGSFLVETGDRKVLVDLGFGDFEVPFPPVDAVFRGGRLLDSLKQAGASPTEIDTVLFTHLHLDHVGWTSRAGALTFPNATYLAGAGEWDFWDAMDDPAGNAGPDPEAVQAPLRGRIEAIADGQVVAPGVNAMATPGHTPGHISYVISSGTDRAIILGDSIHCPLQFEEAEMSIFFDVDPALARRTQAKIAAELEGSQTIAANGHFSDAVFGRLVPGQGKKWQSLPNRAK